MEEAPWGSRERLLDPVDRVSEILFGLIMAVTIVGSLSIASAGKAEVRSVLAAALGCNLAWGLVDAVMYLVRTSTERTRNAVLARRVADAEISTAHRLIEQALPEHVVAIVGPKALEDMRQRLVARQVTLRATLGREDFVAAFGIFLLVVVATFPVAAPFLLIQDATFAMDVSRLVTLVMLFFAGLALGRHAGHPHPLRTGLAATLLGAAVIVAVKALGG